MRLFIHTSNLVLLFGIIDLCALTSVTGIIIMGPLMLGYIPYIALAGIFYIFLWWNKMYFTFNVTGSAFPVVFGLDRYGEFNINVLWYVFSVLMLILMCLVTIHVLWTIPIELAVAAASTFACGRGTIQALVMGHVLATAYGRQRKTTGTSI